MSLKKIIFRVQIFLDIGKRGSYPADRTLWAHARTSPTSRNRKYQLNSRVRWWLPVVVSKILTRVSLHFLSVCVGGEILVFIILGSQSVHIIHLTMHTEFLNSSLSCISRLYLTWACYVISRTPPLHIITLIYRQTRDSDVHRNFIHILNLTEVTQWQTRYIFHYLYNWEYAESLSVCDILS